MIYFYNCHQQSNKINPINPRLKKTNPQSKIIIASICLLIFVPGALVNPLFILIAFCYAASISSVYYFGSKIKDITLNIGYIWLSKWALFVISLVLTGTYAPDIFLYAMTLFVLFNISVNPVSFTPNKKAL